MNPVSPSARRLLVPAFFGFTAVLLGAFGAHSLHPLLESHGAVAWWEKAVFYQFVHALALLFLAREEAPRWIAAAFAGGIVFFSGSLYALALAPVHPAWLGVLTPLGGLGFLAGWLGLFLYGWRKA